MLRSCCFSSDNGGVWTTFVYVGRAGWHNMNWKTLVENKVVLNQHESTTCKSTLATFFAAIIAWSCFRQSEITNKNNRTKPPDLGLPVWDSVCLCQHVAFHERLPNSHMVEDGKLIYFKNQYSDHKFQWTAFLLDAVASPACRWPFCQFRFQYCMAAASQSYQAARGLHSLGNGNLGHSGSAYLKLCHRVYNKHTPWYWLAGKWAAPNGSLEVGYVLDIIIELVISLWNLKLNCGFYELCVCS